MFLTAVLPSHRMKVDDAEITVCGLMLSSHEYN